MSLSIPGNISCSEVYFERMVYKNLHGKVARVGHVELLVRLKSHSDLYVLQVGRLRFCGTTEFASGQWAGIELDEPEGKNNGSVGKIQYFKCAPRYGKEGPTNLMIIKFYSFAVLK